jgi:hypothetical protein
LTLHNHHIKILSSQTQWTVYSKKYIYKYDDPFGNEHTYLFSYEGGGGVDIHPDNLSPNIKTCQESITMIPTCDKNHSATSNKLSDENTNNNRSILSMHDLVILHTNIVFPQNSKDDFKAYTQLHGIDIQMHSIPKPPKQKAHNIGLSDLHEEEFRLFAINTMSQMTNLITNLITM